MIEILTVTLPALTGSAQRRAYVYIPKAAEEEPERRFPVLYMFDGHNIFFDEDATYGKCWGLGEYLDSHGTPLIVAAVECNHDPDNGRLSEYAPYSFSAPRIGAVKGRGALSMDWLIHSFKTMIDSTYPTMPDRDHTFIAGSSMGGLMSLYAVSCFNDTFSRAAVLSPALCLGSRKLGKMLQRSKMKEDTVIYMDLGESEIKRPGMRLLFRHFTALLMDKGVKLTVRIVPGGEHNEASWERQIPFFLPTLLYGQEG